MTGTESLEKRKAPRRTDPRRRQPSSACDRGADIFEQRLLGLNTGLALPAAPPRRAPHRTTASLRPFLVELPAQKLS